MSDQDPFAATELDIDLNKPDPSLAPGVDLWRIESAVHKPRGGNIKNAHILLTLSRVNGEGKMTDRVFLEGGGYDRGRQKLAVFLGDGWAGRLNLAEMRNRQAYAYTEVTQFNGFSRLEVKDRDGFPYSGYAPWSEGGSPPPGYVPPAVDDTPF